VSDLNEHEHEREGWLRRRRGGTRRHPGEGESTDETEGGRSADALGQAEPLPPPAQPKAIWTDSHCHLQDDEDPAATLAAARTARVGRVICVGTDAESSRKAVSLASELSGPRDAAQPADAADRVMSQPPAGADGVWRAEMWATIGMHPHDAKVGLDGVNALVEELSEADGLRRARVVAIGECGLDYHYDNSPRGVQREVFAAQISLANRHKLPLVIHTREAWDDTISALEAEGVPDRTIFHCFTGGLPEARRCLDLGAYLSFSGIVTFSNAHELRQAVAHCPLDSLLIETDAPFLTPVPNRGRRNEPSNVALVGNAIAKVKGFEPEVLAAVSWMNAEKAFGLGS
jgi:TatD DNase family protein